MKMPQVVALQKIISKILVMWKQCINFSLRKYVIFTFFVNGSHKTISVLVE